MKSEIGPCECRKIYVAVVVGSNLFPTTKIEFVTTEEGVNKIIKCATEIIAAAMPNEKS
jgi:hypothetical protein